ncbi:hypothetical protein ANCCEY_09207 [Ancylostoma ceylanicum]|uniref:Helitron helicase-like domain-containing protein n=2 Tax=Ancylostoma ceylanicum TaxID=53326 RepID=A0A8I3B280_9BILA|nr:hypothetical protein ANCCEY_09207 [Ancylostoma ceylanicum]EYC44369.1 hypothetical protein Y032_0463g1908 [Ancylostoma ceylanicum]
MAHLFPAHPSMSRRDANRRRANRERMRVARNSETQDDRDVRLAADAERHQHRRALESIEENGRRRAANSQHMELQRANESVDESIRRRAANSRQMQLRRTNETSMERERRLLDNADRQVRRRSNAVARDEERGRNAQRQLALRARETSTDRHRRQVLARDAAVRRADQLRMASAGVARRAAEWPLPHYLGPMDVECSNCGAKHFAQARISSNGHSFNACCNFGRVSIRMFEMFPTEIQSLLEGQDERCKHFRAMIRNYNSVLAMASMTATVDTPSGVGPYCFRIHGQVYHSTGALRPLPGQPSSFAQIYIFDTEEAANELAGRPVNRECRRDIFVQLFNVMQRDNIFAQSYRMMDGVVREEQERARQENRQHIPVKMVFEKKRH